MKKPFLSIFIAFLFYVNGYSQTSEVKNLNLDFEQVEGDRPLNWVVFGSEDYKVSIDSLESKSGKFSAVIENTGQKSDFKSLHISLPDNYIGRYITLSGYIKTENVTEGHAGLWMRIDPQIAFDNMNNRGITGTTDWQKYEITFALNPENTDKIIIGGILVGKGKMWIDDLSVSIDGKDIKDKKYEIFKREILPAEEDKEFDNGSKIIFPKLDKEVIYNLELMGRIWGFMKYHHPEIAKGNYNWDYELFRVLPSYLAAKNTEERDKVLLTWIEKYGELPACEACQPTSNDAVLKPDHSWIHDSNMSINLKSLLLEVYDKRNQEKNYYVSLYPVSGNPDFSKEKSYSKNLYPDSGFRLISLYRYWNMIEYFFPNKHLTDKNWDTVLQEYLADFIQAKNELEYELATLRLIGEVNDSHAYLSGGGSKIAELRGNNYAPFRGEFVESKFLVTDYYNPEHAETSKLKVGDEITHINGKGVEAIIDSLKVYYPSSNEAAMLRDISLDLLRSPLETINLKYISENQSYQHNITLFEMKMLNMYAWYKVDNTQKSYKILDGNIGYVTLANIKQEDISEIKKAFKKTKGIIIDIRNYPSTFVPFSLGSFFISKSTPFVKFTNVSINNPGEFTLSKSLEIPRNGKKYDGKLVVLVNEYTQSQAEYTSMAFRASKNSTIVGCTTAGADGNVSPINLPGGLRTQISGIGVYYPDGSETQRIGIVPDIIIRPSIEGIKKGKDEVFDKAVELILKD